MYTKGGVLFFEKKMFYSTKEIYSKSFHQNNYVDLAMIEKSKSLVPSLLN
jgi:hypothetical protein